MITIEVHADRYVELRPEGAMSEDDFEKLRDAFDGFVNEHDSVPNLLVRPKGIPHWASPAAMGKHLHFLKEHHRLVRTRLLWSATWDRWPSCRCWPTSSWRRACGISRPTSSMRREPGSNRRRTGRAASRCSTMDSRAMSLRFGSQESSRPRTMR